MPFDPSMGDPLGIFFMIFGIVGYLWTARAIAGAASWELAYGEPKTDDYIFGIFLGMLAALPWPVSLPIFYLYTYRDRWVWAVPGGFSNVLAPPPPRIKNAQKIERAKKKQRQLEERVSLADRYMKGEIDLNTFEARMATQLAREDREAAVL